MNIEEMDVNELAMGIEEEAEHTGDLPTRIKIALDHLKEDPQYYTKLNSVMKGLTEILAEQATQTLPEMGIVKTQEEERSRFLKAFNEVCKSCKPMAGEKKQEFISRCIRTARHEGSTQDEAAGMCYGIYRHEKGED